MKKNKHQHILDCIRIHNNKYSYLNWSEDVKTTDIVSIQCPIHGEFNQRLNDHKQGNGCLCCSRLVQQNFGRRGADYFRALANSAHNNKYDYSLLTDNVIRHSVVKIICPTHGEFEQILNSHIQGRGCSKCGNVSGSQNKLKGLKYFIDRASDIHNNKYDYSLVSPDVKSIDIVKIICPTHGEFEQILNSHIQGRGCSRCSPSKMSDTMNNIYGYDHPRHSHISPQSLELLNDKEWLRSSHQDNQQPLSEIASKLDISPTTVGRRCKKHNIEIKHFFRSVGENQIGNFLTEHNAKIITNVRDIIPPQELDIFLPEHNIAIEYCGLYWHSEQKGKGRHYHENKWKRCKEKGIQLITMFEDEWIERQEQVKQKILSLLKKDNRKIVYARKCNVVNVTTKTKQKFFEKNHIQGNGPGSINIGLVYNNELVACMSFIKQKEQHYLNRYATSCRVVGGFSKLLKYFQTNYDWKKLISFADIRWSNGNLYEQTGWRLDSILAPDYYYSADGHTRIHKFNYRRKNLPRLLEHFDPKLSEKQNCDSNGVSRIWDCGKLRYIIENE